MKRITKLLIILLSFWLNGCYKDDGPAEDGLMLEGLNLDFELSTIFNASRPMYWGIGGDGFNISLDNKEKHRGNLSLKMVMPGAREDRFGVFSNTLPIEHFAGKNVEYRGWIKTVGVTNGYAGLWMRVDGPNSTNLGFDNMRDRGLSGDNNWKQVSINLDVNKNAIAIYFGGLFPGEGITWFDDLELYVDGIKIIDKEPEPKTTLTQKEIEAFKKYIYPLRTYEPDGGDTKDLTALDNLIGNSKVVALGEVSHGSSEIYKMKNRIIQYLAENNGFDIFSIEANMPESYKLNDYTVRGEGNPKTLIAGMYFWTWRTEEVLNMVEWMRRYNQPTQRITFTGFDMQYYQGALDEFLDYFKGNEEVEALLADLKKKLDLGWANIPNDVKQEIDSILEFLMNTVETATFPMSEKEWLNQNIVIIQQYVARTNGSLWRDKCMADNFLWIKEHNPDAKSIIWAHNGHIMKTNQMMGYHLAQKLADDYKTFGFTFSTGFFTATGNWGLTSYEAAQANPSTLEYYLNQLNEPIFILDLKKIKSNNDQELGWLLKPIYYRNVGAVGGLGPQGEFRYSNISDDFDYLIFMKTSTPSTLLTLP